MKKNVISFCVVLGLMYVFSVVLLGIGSVIIWKTGVTAKSISMAVILFVLPALLMVFGGVIEKTSFQFLNKKGEKSR